MASFKNIPEADGVASRSRRRFYLVWTLVGVCLLLGVAVYMMDILSLPMGILLWTAIIVFCLGGMVDWFEEKGLNRFVGTTIAYFVLLIVMVVIFVLLFSPAFGISAQLVELAQAMPTYISNFATWISDFYDRFSYLVESQAIIDWLKGTVSSLSTALTTGLETSAAGLVSLGSGLVNGVMAIGFGLVIAFWVLLELPAIDREMRRLIGPNHEEDYSLLTLTVTRVVGGFIQATLLQCLIMGVSYGILFAVASVPSALALAGITGILNIIPVVGPWLGVIAAALAALFVSPMTALVVLVGAIAIQQIVYTFISPKLMQNSVDIHPALVLFVLFIGSGLGGAMGGLSGQLVGMLLAIPAVAIMKSLFVYYFEKSTGRQLVAYDGVFFQGTPSGDGVVDPLADALSPANYEMEQAMVEENRIQRTEQMRVERAAERERLEQQRTGKIELPRVERPTLELPFVKKKSDNQDSSSEK